MTSELTFEVSAGFDRVRADKVVHAQQPELSRSRIQRLFDAGLVWREDEALTKSDKLSAGDVVTFTIPPPVPLELRPVEISLDVLYEDDDLIVINKSPGMVVHPGAGTGEDTLVHALLHHCAGQLSGIGGVERPGIVHRLDRETSGVMVAAKRDAAFLGLSRAFAGRKTAKTYLALVAGAPTLAGGSVDAPIGRHPVHRQKMAVMPSGREAQSDWEVLERFTTPRSAKQDRLRVAAGGAAGEAVNVAALLQVRIHTGRTHQIRVHLAHSGFPIAGDPTYGWQANQWPLPEPPPRVMLHAWQLAFEHPVTKEPMELEAPVPDDMEAVVEELRAIRGSDGASR